MDNEICENCKYYQNRDTYLDTGYCTLNYDYVKANDGCIDFEEAEDERTNFR